MTLIIRNIIYRTTISCGCPVWLSSATILIVTIVLHINLLLPYISDPKAFQEDFRKQTRNENLAKLLLLTYLTVIILDLSFAVIGLWGILKRVPLLLLAYIVWSIFLMSAIAYAIYLVNKERSFSLEFYNSVVSPILALEYKPSSVGVVEIVMCIPIRHLSLSQRNGQSNSQNTVNAGISLIPYFDPSMTTNVTALVGKSAYLTCRVRNLGNKTVSWIRHRDIHILTSGSYTYTTDQRFQAHHRKNSDEWTLQIKYAQKRDAGMYECQISTQPVRSFFVHLNVVVPTATILGGPDLHVDKGSTLNLTCEIKYSPEPPAYIFWYHHDQVINADPSRGASVSTIKYEDTTTSSLIVPKARLSDSGKYSCSSSNADIASIQVHVLNGESPAAMQTGSAGLSNSSINILILMTLCWLYSHFMMNLRLKTHIH